MRQAALVALLAGTMNGCAATAPSRALLPMTIERAFECASEGGCVAVSFDEITRLIETAFERGQRAESRRRGAL